MVMDPEGFGNADKHGLAPLQIAILQVKPRALHINSTNMFAYVIIGSFGHLNNIQQ
jgi:hypothetical protein